mmetsp:Transcript_407/g.522  ORF Transcript_407/g.522 Transcript_407/m.522 type:complete len:163 (+) Transcript_407:73-561(+)
MQRVDILGQFDIANKCTACDQKQTFIVREPCPRGATNSWMPFCDEVDLILTEVPFIKKMFLVMCFTPIVPVVAIFLFRGSMKDEQQKIVFAIMGVVVVLTLFLLLKVRAKLRGIKSKLESVCEKHSNGDITYKVEHEPFTAFSHCAGNYKLYITIDADHTAA